MSALRFLLLEDSLLDAELLQALLTESGIACKMEQVKTRIEFQTALEQGGFDLILSDYSLPDFDGITALEIAQHQCPDVPFIFVTATMGEEVAIETLKQGATDYVLKQRLERLIPSIRRSLREAQERRARQQAEAESKQAAEALRASAAQLRQQKEELEKANQVKDEFLAVLSHELRSPLNAIVGWSKILRTRKLDPKTLDRALETIERNAQLQTQLIEDLLDISRIIRGNLTLHPQPTSLVTAIEGAMDTMRLAAQAKCIDLQFTILDGEAKSTIENSKFCVLGDPSRLQQIIWNLLSNAIKFTPNGGQVKVRLSTVGNREESHHSPLPPRVLTPGYPHSPAFAQITVKDTGIGIESDFIPYVFDSFRQADGSTTRKQGGLGLGLAIVRHLVELHGGTVTASSLGEGQGATFTVHLPLLEERGGAEEERGREGEGGNFSHFPTPYSPLPTPHSPLIGVRVLLVDDDVDSRDFLVFALNECGAIAIAVADPASALQVLVSFKPDVLLSDIGMPEQDGYSFIRQVRTLPPALGGQIPAIALTAYAGDKDRQTAIAAGFQRHLSKPVGSDELTLVIAELISH